MKQALVFALTCAALVAVFALLGGASSTTPIRVHALQKATPSALAPEIPADTKVLELDKPIVEGLDPTTAIRFYTFNGKANEKVRVSVEPKAGNFFTTLTIMSGDLETILGGTVGETLVSGSVVVMLPTDGMYAVSVEYADSTIGTPAPGQYQIGIAAVKP